MALFHVGGDVDMSAYTYHQRLVNESQLLQVYLGDICADGAV